MKIQHIALLILLFIFTSCKKENKNNTTSSVSCHFAELNSTATQKYNFESNFAQQFIQSSRWESNNADITLVAGKGQLTANASSTSSALETWKLYNKQMPYNKSWEISVDINVPLYWNNNGGNEAQVGAGIFVGKPVSAGQSEKVFECNMATVNAGERFVQAQLVANRLGDDPINVEQIFLAQNKEVVRLKITFCTNTKALTLYVDKQKVGKGQKIDTNGLDNWQLKTGDLIDVGIMGFAENTVITNNQPTLDNFEYKIYE